MLFCNARQTPVCRAFFMYVVIVNRPPANSAILNKVHCANPWKKVDSDLAGTLYDST